MRTSISKNKSNTSPEPEGVVPSVSLSDKERGERVPTDRLDQQIYEEIHQAIIGQQLPPGTKLGEEALSGIFDVNRSRIRKVLQRLAYDQLVDLYPNRGAFVAQLSVKEAREVFGARRLIEPSLVESAAASLTRAQLKELRAAVRLEREAFGSGDRQGTIRLSGEFHVLLANLSGNAVLTTILSQLISRTSLIIAMYEVAGRSGCNSAHHEQLVSLLERGESQKASAFMREHLEAIETSLRLDSGPAEPIDLRSVFRSHR